METTASLSPRFGLKSLLAILGVGVLAFGLPYLAAVCAIVTHLASPRGPTLQWLYVQHTFQLALALTWRCR